jgi:DNA primase
MSTIDEIKARIDLVDLVSETVQLRRSGKTYTGFCPFHSNTRTPAFVVWPETGTWRCFGQCNEGGDIFGFLMKRDNLDFSEALRVLAEKTGVQLRPPTLREMEAVEAHDRLRVLLEDAVTFYRHQLLHTPSGQAALEYLHNRGLTDQTVENWGLGYAPEGWETALGHFRGRRYSEKDLLDAGLVTEREGGGVYDRFRHRIMFPIRDERSRMAGFGARVLKTDDFPKFLNSPQTAVFDKSRILYGLDQARKDIRTLDQVVIVEGYLDVIALHQAGFTNVVSPMGTALTEHQLYLVKRYTRRLILALDSDAAGAQATLRGLQVARQAMDRLDEVVFDARGLLSHEARLQADIRVTTLPEGMDPDDVVNRDPEEWEHIVEAAQPIVVHVMHMLAQGRDLDDPKIKSEIAGQVMPLIEDIPDSIERDTYRQRLARLLKVNESVLTGSYRGRTTRRTRVGRGQRSAPAVAPTGSAQPSLTQVTSSNLALEAYCLGVLMRRPDLVYHVDRVMQEFRLPRLGQADFERAEHQAIFALVQESLTQDIAEPLHFVLNGLSFPMLDKADELLARTDRLDPVEDRVLEDLLRAFLNLRILNVRESLAYYQFSLEDSQQQAEPGIVKEYLKAVQEYSQMLKRLDQAIGRYTSRSVDVKVKG